MPTYEYACSKCGHGWEEIQKISAPASTECPQCHEATAKRQISGGNFILKGSGWYADLYSKPPASSSAKGGEGGGSSKGSDGKSEAKPEAKGSGESSSAGSTTTPSTPATPAK